MIIDGKTFNGRAAILLEEGLGVNPYILLGCLNCLFWLYGLSDLSLTWNCLRNYD